MYFLQEVPGIANPVDAVSVDGNTIVVGLGIFFATEERIHEWNMLFDSPLWATVFRSWQYSSTGSTG